MMIKMWCESVRRGVCAQFSGVVRLRRALLLLAAAACTAAALLYWRQQTYDTTHRPLLNEPNGLEMQWSWICRNERCERMLASESTVLQSLQTCNMLCASTQLWPQPTGPVTLATSVLPLRASSLRLEVAHAPSSIIEGYLRDAFALMQEDLRALELLAGSQVINSAREFVVRVTVDGDADPRITLHTNESYHLRMGSENSNHLAVISAHSFCGARHGLETLSQLIWFDPYTRSLLTIEAATVVDEPKFHYRGFLLDTSRNYFPVADILQTIDAMGASKLNTFHWHISDSQSFPLQLSSVPQLAEYGAYGPQAVYTEEDVRTVVRRGRLRGVRVVLEVDAPGHVGRAWAWGPRAGYGDLALCVEAEPWAAYCGEPPCGQLNPRNPHVYTVLEQVYREILQLTGTDDVFHLGGDEVSERCWMQHFNDTDPMDLWLEFTQKSLMMLKKANNDKLPELTLLWSSGLTRTPYLEKLDKSRFGIQVWGGSQWPESHAVLDAGFRTVLSHVDAWYLDCGFGSWRDSSDGHCAPYHSWQQIYEHRPWAEESSNVGMAGDVVGSPVDGGAAYGVPANGGAAGVGVTGGGGLRRVLGGEACLWSEQVGAGGASQRAWPRTAALAERLWSDPATGALPDVYLRLDTHRARLVARGVPATVLWPHWCTQNPFDCL